MKENVVSILAQIGRYNLLELFTVELRKILEDSKEYIDFIHILLQNLTQLSSLKEQVHFKERNN